MTGRPFAGQSPWRRCAALVAAGVVIACGRPAATATEAVVQFYTLLDAAGVHRVPDESQRQIVRPLLTDSLDAALATAAAVREAYARAHPGEKPPFADGDVFSSLFEGPSSFVVVDSVARADTTFVVVKFTNASVKPPVDWRDTVVVTGRAGAYRIADVRYGGGWEFGMQGRLLEAIRPR